MENKLIEIRDRGTFIPALCTSISAADGYLARRGGFGNRLIIVTKLNGCEAHYDPFEWPGSARTMRNAHKYIVEHWDTLLNNDVVDVEFILGETAKPKTSEAHDHYA